MEARLILDEPAVGSWNMAVDEVLLRSAIHDQRAVLRFYRWVEPTLSLGYFQSLADRRLHPSSMSCPVVRRSTGGGAILHDAELTYSMAWPLGRRLSFVTALYDAFHQSLVEELQGLGIYAQLCPPKVGRTQDSGEIGRAAPGCGAALMPERVVGQRPDSIEVAPTTDSSDHDSGSEPFLCFQRRCPGDVILDGYKVCGSAQRRNQGAVLQHGSILLQRSPAAPELPGISDVAGQLVEWSSLAKTWGQRLQTVLGVNWVPSEWTDNERIQAKNLQETRFGAESWNARR